MLKKIRVIVAAVLFVLVTLLFFDFTGVLHGWFGWMAKTQFVPAVLAGSVIPLVVIGVLTLVFGRIYCSVVCPLGVLQDGISHVSGWRPGKKRRFRYSRGKTWLRILFLSLFVAALIAGTAVVVSLLDPYAAYGRIATSFFTPLYRLGNNLLAWFAERAHSYAFYSTDVFVKSWIVFGIAAVSFAIIAVLSWRGGRTYCNTVCPVGTFLGIFSRFSFLRPEFDLRKCVKCGACEKACKASCVDFRSQSIDHSRCVTCFNCIESCKFDAMKYRPRPMGGKKDSTAPDGQRTVPIAEANGISRRSFLSIAGTIAVTTTVKAQQLQMDGGLAEIEDKKVPHRKTPVAPPGSHGLRNLRRHCTACQLCVSSCPNGIMYPSTRLSTLMQPELRYEKGFCRPECTECSQVCPTGAIVRISPADKSALSIGKAVWIRDNCVVITDERQCRACESHCPTGAIILVERDPGTPGSLKIPVVDKEICIGCGACEYYCPARPFSAIYVEGNEIHHLI